MAPIRLRAGKRLWNPEDDELLRSIYPHASAKAVARRLGRSVCAIYGRADKLDLEKSAACLASPDACRLRRGDNVGAAFRYPKGHVPANKGLRRPGYAPGRMRETQFKKGVATNWRPVGDTRLVDGYLYRKVSDIRNVPWTRNWRCEHFLIWENANGPIPPGHCVKFKNGDRTDIRPDNLELITRRANMARNSVHNLPAPLVEVIQLTGALKRKINRKQRKHDEEQDRRSA